MKKRMILVLAVVLGLAVPFPASANYYGTPENQLMDFGTGAAVGYLVSAGTLKLCTSFASTEKGKETAVIVANVLLMSGYATLLSTNSEFRSLRAGGAVAGWYAAWAIHF